MHDFKDQLRLDLTLSLTQAEHLCDALEVLADDVQTPEPIRTTCRTVMGLSEAKVVSIAESNAWKEASHVH